MIVIFGSINVDLIVPVPRLPRPGETLLGGDYALLPGGKGANQSAPILLPVSRSTRCAAPVSIRNW